MVITLLLFVISNIFLEKELQSLFVLTLALMMISMFSNVKGRVVDILSGYSETVFFVLALHNIIVLSQVGKLLNGIFPDRYEWVVYWIAPFVTLSVCVFTYHIMKFLMPQFIKVVCGGR